MNKSIRFFAQFLGFFRPVIKVNIFKNKLFHINSTRAFDWCVNYHTRLGKNFGQFLSKGGTLTQKNFWIAIHYGKIGRKKWSEKSDILKKKIFRKNSKPVVFILHKVNLGVGLYFSGAISIWDVWDMAEKNTQSLCPKFRFSPIAP